MWCQQETCDYGAMWFSFASRYVSGRTRTPGEINGKSANVNNCLRNVIFPEYEGRPQDIPLRELVVVFDADMAARRNFLLKVGGKVPMNRGPGLSWPCAKSCCAKPSHPQTVESVAGGKRGIDGLRGDKRCCLSHCLCVVLHLCDNYTAHMQPCPVLHTSRCSKRCGRMTSRCA